MKPCSMNLIDGWPAEMYDEIIKEASNNCRGFERSFSFDKLGMVAAFALALHCLGSSVSHILVAKASE